MLEDVIWYDLMPNIARSENDVLLVPIANTFDSWVFIIHCIRVLIWPLKMQAFHILCCLCLFTKFTLTRARLHMKWTKGDCEHYAAPNSTLFPEKQDPKGTVE